MPTNLELTNINKLNHGKSAPILLIIRFNDCDLFGHLNNSRYLDYFLNAREDHLRDHYQLDLAAYYQRGLAWVIGSHEIAYLRPANYNESVVIQTTLLGAGDDDLHLEALMTDQGGRHLKAIMHSKLIAVDPKTLRKTKHPEDFMRWGKTVEDQNLAAFTLQERIADWKK